MFDLWFKGWRRKRILKIAAPEHWPNVLHQRLWYWRYLSSSQQSRLLQLSQIFLHEKEIVVSQEIRNPEPAKLLVAATASLMLLGFRDLYCFDKIKSVVLQTGSVVYRKRASSHEVVSQEEIASGVYMQGGPVALSWDDVSRQCFSDEHGHNVVIHEFAHHIDDLNGVMDGEPPFPTVSLANRWKAAAAAAMERVEELESIGITSVIDAYGLTNKLEFFAVSCEAFYCNPIELEREFREVFELLTLLFQLNPQQWFERD